MVQYFDETIHILDRALKSIEISKFEQMIDECEDALRNHGKVIASGLGKNVPVCEKFVGAMVSLGLDANFMHTNSAVHGDLGMVHREDITIVLSKSGTTAETVYLVNFLKQKKCKIWLITFNKSCPLSKKINTLSVELEHEGDLWNIMPNHSTVLNLIILQTIAMTLGKRMGVQIGDFKNNHPGGTIGEKLRNV